jgi:hybrid cluster-associated redox disulfide protein
LISRKDGPAAPGHPVTVTTTDVLSMLVADLLRQRPAAAQVFVRRGMSCPGCPFAPFETVAEVADIYRQDPADLAASLLQAGEAGAAAAEDR